MKKQVKKIVSAFSNNFTKPVYKNGRRFTQANQVIKIEPEDLTKIFESCVFKFGSHLALRIKKIWLKQCMTHYFMMLQL